MPKESTSTTRRMLDALGGVLRKCLFSILSVGPIPSHVAFIMDGNRRYAKRRNLVEGDGHRAGFSSLLTILSYCYELGIKHVTVYAFSIDNFKRQPEEVQCLMDLMLEKIEELLQKGSILDQYGIRLYFIGNLKLLNENVRIAAEKAMKATSSNKKTALLICVAYTSCDEMVHAVQRSFEEKLEEVSAGKGNEEIKKINGSQLKELEAPISATKSNFGVQNVNRIEKRNSFSETVQHKACLERAGDMENVHEYPIITLSDIEKNMYMAVAPDPDIVVRSSGETRLSNFLLWQTAYCPLYAPKALWPDMGLWEMVWTVLSFQRSYSYLQKRRKQS